MTKSSWGHSVVTGRCSPCEIIIMALWYQNYDITSLRCLWGNSDTSWAHQHEVTVLSQYNVTDTQDDHITLRTQWCHSMMSQVMEMIVISVMSQIYEMTTSSWGRSVVTGRCSPCEIIMISKLWHNHCEICVRSQWYKLSTSPWCHNIVTIWCHRYTSLTTSPWGHSVVTMWCHRYMRWPHHHEVTVLSQDDAHHVRSLWYQNYDITIVRFVWGHSDTSWAHHHDVTILWQYDVTDTQDDYVTMRSQCRHNVMSQIHEMTTSSWGHSVVTGRCSPCEIIMISKLCHHQCEIFVRSQW